MTKEIIITGGTDGIGLATVENLIENDNKLIIVGKNAEKGNNIINKFKNSKIDFFQCDLCENEQIDQLIKKLNKLKKIDVLINNAGALFVNREENSKNIEKTFALNHLSYCKLSLGLLDKLENSQFARIINVASNAHKRYELELDDLENKKNYNGWKSYCRSKLLNVLFTYSFNNEINTKVTCNCIHPGFVNSNFGNNNNFYFKFLINIFKELFAIKPKKASDSIKFLATSDEIKNISGKYFYKNKIIKSSKYSYNKSIAKIIWKKTLDYIN